MPRRLKRIPGELVQAGSDVIRNKRVTKVEYTRRLSICNTCPLLNEGSVHEDGFVRDAVSLHKEVRESLKDLMRMQETWGPTTENGEIHNTINILKVELGKESPESWARIREKLVGHVEDLE